MKYLNKIIFINCANISYAEVAVDGNVHFTGTQGVGKSTVLRALLFFYNADKHKLGIQHGQKPFDEFYFRQANSYILYEVMRDNGAYTVLVSRYQGHASWRFIDAPYNRDWLIDPDGQVMGDWVKIRERIDRNISQSARIESGAMFKDIIFGNTRDSKYTRYALVQSSHYQNIPRSIQNVFLNTKLDADFIKNTIIQSMADEDLPIDIKTYRRLIQSFEREYDEIDCWFRKSKDGTVPVRKLASKIAEEGRKVIALDQQLLDVWRKLNYAVAECEKQIPLLEGKSVKVDGQLDKEKMHRSELDSEYNKDKDSLNQKLGGAKAKLDEISKKRKYFAGLQIEEKLALADREATIKQELEEKNTLLDNLLKEHKSIEEKYDIAKGNQRIEKEKFELSQKEALNKKRNELQIKREHIQAEASKLRDNLIADYNAWRNESDDRLHLLMEDEHRADSSLKELNRWHPKETEKASVKEELHKLDVLEKNNYAQLKDVEHEIASIQKEFEAKADNLKRDTERKVEELDKARDEIKSKIAEIDSLLSNLDGSFYEWLTKNVDGWENTIGKLVDEEKVLYAQGLEPTLVSSSESIYGVSIDLDSIELTHRSPDDLRHEKKALEDRYTELGKEIFAVTESSDEESSRLSKKLTEKLNPLRQQRTSLSVESDKIPTKRQNLENDLHALDMEEQEILNRERDLRQKAYNDALLKVQAENDSRTKREATYNRDVKNADSDAKKKTKELADILEGFKKTLAQESTRRLQEFDMQIKHLDEQMKAELSGKGVDTSLLDEYRKAVDNLKQLVSQIDADRRIVAEYQVAEKDLFSIEPSVRGDIKSIESQIKQISQKYEDRKAKILKKIEELEKEVKGIRKELEKRREGLNEYHQVVESEHLVPDSFISDCVTVVTNDDCHELIIQLRGTVNSKRSTVEILKATVVDFNKYFKPQNAFSFNTMPVTDSDYFQIAANLQEFLDNNKIEEYRRRTSEHYKDIISRISTEVGSLMSRRSDVDAVIQDINRDFIEKNFAGVIRSIELRAIESSDKLMQLLISIQSYTEENMLSIGEMNLFSSDNRDEVNLKVVDYLKSFTKLLLDDPSCETVSLSNTFTLQFRVKENDNDTGWVEKINNVGSDGTDILVKAMVNIMLINVFKKKASKKSGDFIVHCMMDEIGRLHPNNIKGILQFANSRNIYLINSSPTSYNPYDYKYTYMLSKHNVKTRIDKIMKRNM